MLLLSCPCGLLCTPALWLSPSEVSLRTKPYILTFLLLASRPAPSTRLGLPNCLVKNKKMSKDMAQCYTWQPAVCQCSAPRTAHFSLCMVLLQLAEGSQGHGWPKPLHRLSGSENREECWLCFDYERLYKFQKIDFSRPPWLGMKARRVFIESGPRWLDFWPWPCGQWIQPWMSFVLLLALQGLTFPDGLVDLATTAVPWALFALFPCFYNCE